MKFGVKNNNNNETKTLHNSNPEFSVGYLSIKGNREESLVKNRHAAYHMLVVCSTPLHDADG